jgi:quercetin dioxygenase-like cupin family protein
MPGRVRTEIHLRAEDTGSAFCLQVDERPDGWSLPPHLHHGAAETIHMLTGAVRDEIGGRSSPLGPGDSVHVPAGAVHFGGNLGETRGRRIVIFSSAGMKGFFPEIGSPTRGRSQSERLAAASNTARLGIDSPGTER